MPTNRIENIKALPTNRIEDKPINNNATEFTHAITVNTTADTIADDGQCSLREAITAANNNTASGQTEGECIAGTAYEDDAIHFNIAPGGRQTIILNSLLPPITTNVTIFGATQPGYINTPLIAITYAGPSLQIHHNDPDDDLRVSISNLDLSLSPTLESGEHNYGLVVMYNMYALNSSPMINIHNNIITNRKHGIHIARWQSKVASDNMSVHCNYLANNVNGIYMETYSEQPAYSDSISWNWFSNNDHGLNIYSPNYIDNLQIQANYWGAPDGPSNLGGSGDSYHGYVETNTFLSLPHPSCIEPVPTTITVNTTADTTADDGQCSLREAITAANNNTASGQTAGECVAGFDNDLIAFDIANGGPQTIHLNSLLPEITTRMAIDGATQPDYVDTPLITIFYDEDIFKLNGASNVKINALNLSTPFPVSGNGIHIYDSYVVHISNNIIQNRSYGVNVDKGSDIAVHNNDLRYASLYALSFRNLTFNDWPRAISVANNNYDGATNGIFLRGVDHQIISDGSEPDTNIIISPQDNITGVQYMPLNLHHSNDIYITNVDLSKDGNANNYQANNEQNQESGSLRLDNYGISIVAGSNIVIMNTTINNRETGINAHSTTDLTIQNNDLRNHSSYALALTSINADQLAKGVLIANNNYDNSTNGILLKDMNGQTISNGITPNTNITIAPTDNITGVSNYALALDNVTNTTISLLDLSGTGTGTGVHINNTSDNIYINQTFISNRQTGVTIDNATRVQLNCTNLTNNSHTGLHVTNNSNNNNITAHNSHFTNNSIGIINDLNTITVNATDNYWGAPDGPSTSGGSGDSYSGNVLAIPFLTTSPNCIPDPNTMIVVNTTTDTIADDGQCTLREAITSANQDQPSGTTIGECITGFGEDTIAFDIAPGGQQTIILDTLLPAITTDMIIDGSTQPGYIDTPIIAINNQFAEQITNFIIQKDTNSPLNVTINALDLSLLPNVANDQQYSYYGITYHNNSYNHANANIAITNSIIKNRDYGVYIYSQGTEDNWPVTISCNYFANNFQGIYIEAIGPNNTDINSINNNWFSQNSVAINALPPTTGNIHVQATQNYWGASDGPANLGGSGDKYSGNVTADPFLSSPPACVNPIPTIITVNTTTDITADDGQCSLREAIIAANNNAASGQTEGECTAGLDNDIITFDIASGSSQTINLNTLLPEITTPMKIDGSTQPGYIDTPLITVLYDEDIFKLNGTSNVEINALNLSTPFPASGNGIYVYNSNNINIRNNIIQNRTHGVDVYNGSDITVHNNDLRYASLYALSFRNVTADLLDKAISVADNNYDGATNGILLRGLNDQIISDGSEPNTNITIAPHDNITGVQYMPLDLHYFTNVHITNVNLSEDVTSNNYQTNKEQNQGSNSLLLNNYGINIVAGNNILITNTTIKNRETAINAHSATDLTIQNNDLRHHTSYALSLTNINANLLPQGIRITNNNYDGSTNGILLKDMADQIISNGTTLNTNITIAPTDNITGVSNYALVLDKITNTTISHLNLSSSNTGTGIYITNASDDISINQTIINNRQTAITVDNATNILLNCNYLTDNVYSLHVTANSNNNNITAHDNYIAYNAVGIRNELPSLPVTAIDNYWGAPDGPSNLGGSGDSYSGNVSASPFLTTPPSCVNVTATATDGSYATVENMAITGNVIHEDTGYGIDNEPNNVPLSIYTYTLPISGTLLLDSNGTFTYTPVIDWFETVNFTYAIADQTSHIEWENMGTISFTMFATSWPNMSNITIDSTENTLILNWDPVMDANTYHICQSTSDPYDTTTTEIATIDAPSTSWTSYDGSNDNDQLYYYMTVEEECNNTTNISNRVGTFNYTITIGQ